MAGIGSINLRVAVVDSDFYARHAINAYLAWDRRTRMICKFDQLAEFWIARETMSPSDLPNVIIIDANHIGGAEGLGAAITRLRKSIDGLLVVCLAQFADLDLLDAAAEAGAKAYLLKQDVRIHIAWALCHAHLLAEDDFLISGNVVEASRKLAQRRIRGARQLAGPRRYEGMTDRIREAIELYAIEGMSHRLIANEMGIAESTVHHYVKQAYSILESSHDDEGDYPNDMSPQEVAFMRITALELVAL